MKGTTSQLKLKNAIVYIDHSGTVDEITPYNGNEKSTILNDG